MTALEFLCNLVLNISKLSLNVTINYDAADKTDQKRCVMNDINWKIILWAIRNSYI